MLVKPANAGGSAITHNKAASGLKICLLRTFDLDTTELDVKGDTYYFPDLKAI